jgi:hypothetical protein
MKNSLILLSMLLAFSTCQKDTAPEKLIADFEFGPADGASLCSVAPCEVKFRNNSSPADVTYLWDFGDGSISTDKDPTHLYQNGGDFQVKLSVTSKSGNSANAQKTISFKSTTTFTKNFSPNVGERVSPKLLTKFDSGDFLILGERNQGPRSLYVLGVDNPSGEILSGYPKYFDISVDVYLKDVIRLNNDRFAVVGRTWGSPSKGIFLLLDSDGSLLPNYPIFYEPEILREANGVVELPDGNIGIIGSAMPTPSLGEMAFIKVDQRGKVFSGYPRTYGFDYGSDGTSIARVDNFLYICGNTWRPESGVQGVILQTDQNGNLQLNFPQLRGGIYYDTYSKIWASNQRIIAVGSSQQNGGNDDRIFISNLTRAPNWTFEPDQFYRPGAKSEAVSVLQIDDSNYVVLGVNDKPGTNERDPFLVFLNDAGRVRAESNVFNSSLNQIPLAISTTEDKGLLILAVDLASQIILFKVKNNGQF